MSRVNQIERERQTAGRDHKTGYVGVACRCRKPNLYIDCRADQICLIEGPIG
jgi:hypothetical protein